MDNAGLPSYTIELWSPRNVLLADITALCHNREFTMQRNEAETFSASINLVAFETYCLTKLGITNPREILEPYWSEVRIKRNDTYLFGGFVVAPTFGKADDFTFRAQGYLNYFKYRHLDASKSYSDTNRAVIASDLIATVQQRSSRGVTFNSNSELGSLTLNRTFPALQNVKGAIQDLATLEDAPFDFAFSAAKQFTTYKQIGSRRSDLLVVFGGADENTDDFYLERGPQPPFNEVAALGSGFGEDQLRSIANDAASEAGYGLWQTQVQHNLTEDQSLLDRQARTDVGRTSTLLEIPEMTITSNELVGIPFIQIGDRIPVEVPGHPFLQGLNKTYRVERMRVRLDDTDFERITLSFDDLGVVQNA